MFHVKQAPSIPVEDPAIVDGMTIPTGVGATSLAIAAARAMETARNDRLFADPWASDFVTTEWLETTAAQALSRRAKDGLVWVAVRTRFLDDFVLAATAGTCRQLVLLGAGLDTRALRLPLPDDTSVFEVDTEEVLAYKESVLSKSARPAMSGARRVQVRADLRDDWPTALTSAGFAPDERSAWLAEGLLVYFTEQENDRLLRQISAHSAPGSGFAVTLSVPGVHQPVDGDGAVVGGSADPDVEDHLTAMRAMWNSDGPADPIEWLAGYGWRAEAVAPGKLAVEYGRVTGASEFSGSRRRLVTATKQ